MGMNDASPQAPLGGDTGDVDYPLYIIDGRVPTAPTVRR